MESIVVHPRIHEKHPEIDDSDVLDAWAGCIRAVPRLDKHPSEYIAIGSDRNGRLIEMVAKCNARGEWLIYHALTPPTIKTLKELKLIGG